MLQQLPSRTIVLLGVGHTNAHIVRKWKMAPLPDTRLVCVSNFRQATYSGMLPGVLAGLYEPQQMVIDLVRLCASAGAELIIGDVVGLDRQRPQLRFADRAPVPFDVLAIGVGSQPTFDNVTVATDAQQLLTIKPMQTLLARLDTAVAAAAAHADDDTLRVTIVGAGAGGVEVALCLHQRLTQQLPHRSLEMQVVCGQRGLLPGFVDSTRDRIVHEFGRRNIQLHPGTQIVAVEPQQLVSRDGATIPADLVIWATGATAPPLLGNLNLPTDERGFLLTDASLQSVSGLPIFAVGDTGTLRDQPLPKAGVYAVRQGPVLWENLQRTLAGRELQQYKPQTNFLRLLNLGDGRALGEYLGRSFAGRWVFRWKDTIDGRFMKKFQDYSLPTMTKPQPAPAAAATMRCVGCGGKVGGSILQRALARLNVASSPAVVVGLQSPDDAAVLQLNSQHATTVTTDFFAAPLLDNYLVGRIAALNAMSDVWAMGARPVAALAMAELPFGDASAQEQALVDLLAGGLRELEAAGARLVGGHTIEGPRTSIGFTIIAEQQRPITAKSALRLDLLLVLTKPIGSGVLLAAHMQAACPAAAMKQLERTLLTGNERAAQIAHDFHAPAITDITGFGLAGHLLEMLTAAGVSAELQLADVPLLAEAEQLIRTGFASTLAPANKHVEARITCDEQTRNSPRYEALFDPQTNGGLLYAVQPTRLLATEGHQVIGRTMVAGADGPRLVVR